MTDNITKREKLYNNLISTGKVSEQELGTKDDFLAAVQDKESASYLYTNLKTKFGEDEIGDSSKFWDYLSSDFDTVQPAKVVQPNNIVQANKSTQPIKSGLAPMTVVPEPITTLQSPFQKEVKAPVSLMSPEQQKAQQELSMPKSVADVDNELKSLKDKDGEFLSLYRQIKTKAKGGYDRGMMSSMGSGGKTLNLFSLFNSPKLTKEEQAFYEQNKDVGDKLMDSEYALLLQRDLLKLRDNLQKYDKNDSALKTYWKGLTQTGLLEDFLTMGQGEIRRNLDLLGIYAKAERKPESLTKEENDLLDVYEDFKTAASSNTDAWFTAGQSSQAMLPFILSMVGTNLAAGGLRAGMRQAFGVATRQTLTGYTKRAVVVNIGKKLGESALFNIMAIPSRPMFYQELSGNRVDGYKKDENGKVVNNGKSLGADVYEASVRTFMEYFAEEFSMATGGAATKLLDSKGTRKLLGSTFGKLRKVIDNKAFKSATKLLDYANIGSIPEEMFEEALTQAGNALFLWSKDDIAQLANPEFYKSVAISVVAMQGAMTGTQLAAGGVGNIIEKGRVNKQASQSIKKLDEIALTVSDESLSNQISLLSDALRSGEIIDDNKDVDNSKAIITYNKILDTIGDNEELADVSATAAKAVIDNAKKYGVYEGIAAMAEKEIGGQFTHAKSPDTVVLTKKGDSTYYVLDQMEDENSSGGGIMIVRDVETGEKKTLNSLEVDDISYITKEEFLNSWMQTKEVISEQEDQDVVYDIPEYLNSRRQNGGQVNQAGAVEQKPIEVAPVAVQIGGQYNLEGHPVTVIDITEEGIGVEDESGQTHIVEQEELSEVGQPMVQQPEVVDVPEEQEVIPTEAIEELIEPQVPLTKEGEPDFDAMGPEMLVRELGNKGLSNDEIADILNTSIEPLEAEKATITRRKPKGINETIKKKEQLKAIEDRIASLSTILKDFTEQRAESAEQTGDQEYIDKFNVLLTGVKAHNMQTPAKKRKSNITSLLKKANEIGLVVRPDGSSNLTIEDSQGKKKTRVMVTQSTKDGIQQHKALSEYPEEVQGFVNRMFQHPEQLVFIANVDKNTAAQAVVNILEGKKTIAANTLLDQLEETLNYGMISFVDDAKQNTFDMSIDDYFAFLDGNEEVMKKVAEEVLGEVPEDMPEDVFAGFVPEEDMPEDVFEGFLPNEENKVNLRNNEEGTEVINSESESQPDTPTQVQGEGVAIGNSNNSTDGTGVQAGVPANTQQEDAGQTGIEDVITQEEAKVNLNPTEGQKEAGNYKKGHVTIQGLDITIEQPKGSVRSGVDPDGKEWSITMNNTYGYALGTKSKDGDHIDIFLGENMLSEKVFVIDQINFDKSFDEHKVMIGFDSLEDAQAAYLSNYEAGWQGLGDISETTMVQFKDWAKMEGRRIKPFTEYKENKTIKEDQSLKEPTFDFMKENPMQRARAIISLSKMTRSNGVAMPIYRWIESVEPGLKVGEQDIYSSKASSGSVNKRVIGNWVVDTKAEQDYYTYLQDGGKSYSEYLKEQKVYDNAIKEKAEAERKVRKEADAIKRKEQHAKSVSEKDSIIKEILQGKTEEQFLTEQLKRSRGYVESLRARKQTQDVISEIELEEINIKSKEKSLKFAYKSFKNLYKLSNGEVVEKYSYKPGDKITVDYGDGRVDNTEYVGSRENQDGSITHIVKPTEVLVNGYVGYDMISPIEESKTEVKEEGESESTPLKIEDYGEKIEGARKDQIKKYFDKINLNGQILSTIFPKPDIKGLIESGLSIKDVSGIKVAHEFATKDKKRGADVIRFYAAYAKNILAESINLEFNSGGYVFTEYGKSQVELRTKAYQQVAKELGDEYLQLDLTKVRISEMSEREVRSLVNKDISGRFKVQYYVSASKYFTTEEEAISAFTELVKGNTTKDTVQYKRKIKVYQSRSTRDYYLGFQPKGKEFIKLSDNYKTAKEAFEYQKNNEADLQIELERIISEQKIGDKKPSVRLKFSNETTRDRVGKDWRGGRNIDSKEFAETFGFRGVEFGNWVNQKERQVFVNNSFDSLMDLAQLLNIPPKAISLSGQLGITFGSRGSGNAAAHYEPGRKIINLTKTQGLGSLAHEWYHAIDNYFAGFGTNITGMKSATKSEFKPEVRDEVKKAFENLYRSLNTGTYKARSRNLDNSRSKNYYSLIHELSARAFENYILSRLNESGQVNDFIVNYISVEDWNGEASKYPYPKAEESKVIYEAFNNLFETLDTKTDENNVTLLYEPLNTYKEYEKEETEKAFGTEERKREAVEKVSNLLREPEYVYHRRGESSLLDKVRPRTVVDTFQESGYVDVLGQKIDTPQDLADIFAIHRSPYIEKHHIIFVKDGIIVGSTATTLNMIHAARTAGMDDIDRLYRSFGADGMYYLHNHPSGNHTPSSQDVYVTFAHKEQFEQNGINLIGHVVIDTDKFSYIDTSKPLLTSYTNRAEIERYLLNDVNEFEYKTAVPKLFTQRESLLANNNPQQRMFEIGKALIGERGYSTVVVYSTPNLSITAYDVVPDGSSVEDIKTAIRDGINSNLGSRAFIVHDGSIEYKWGTLQGEAEDVINTKKMESDDFSKGAYERQLNKDAITLWDKKSEYDSNHYHSNDIPEPLINDNTWQEQVWEQNEDLRETQNLDIYQRNQEVANIPDGYSSIHVAYEPGLRDVYANPKAYDEVDALFKEQGYLSEGYIENTYNPEDFKLKDGYVAAVNVSDNGKPKPIGGSASDDFAITFIGKEVADIYDGKIVQVVRPLETWRKDGKSYTKMSENLYRQPYFYSPTEQALNSIKQEKATPEQWKAMLLKNGAKQAEMDWMQFDEFVEGKKSLTKADIQDWINQNRIEVHEVEKGVSKTFGKKDAIKYLDQGYEIYGIDDNGVEFLIEDLSDIDRADRFAKNEDLVEEEAKYSQYTEPGGKNYKELLLTMPEKTIDVPEYKWLLKDKNGNIFAKSNTDKHEPDKSPEVYNSLYNAPLDGELKWEQGLGTVKGWKAGDNFTSAHYDEPNILAHIRFNEREANGERVLFIEEIQSDWAQKGKKEGFASKPNYKKEGDIYKVYDGAGVFFLDAKTEEEAKEIIRTNPILGKQGVPDMPFKNTDQWVNLTLRRMMTYAAENGFDRIAWTNGEMQAARYDLSKQTDFVDYWRNSNGTYDFGLSVEFNKPSELTESELESYLGKEIASKIINDKTNPTEARPNRLEGENLKVGGEGMKAFYDNIIPAQANKIGKKLGAKVGSIEIPADKVIYNDEKELDLADLSPKAQEYTSKYDESIEANGDYSAEDYVDDMAKEGYIVEMDFNSGEPISVVKSSEVETTSVKSIPITEAIKEQAKIGMPLYKGKHTASNPLKPKTKFSQATEQDKFIYATEFANSFGVNVNVVTDVSQIPASSVKMRRAKGWFNPKTGEVTIVLPNHTSFEDLQATILHEVVAHKGLRGLLGEQFTPTMQRVFYSMSGTKQADYLARYGDKVTAAEEYMSEMAETSQDPTFLEKVIAIIRDAFRALGIELHLSDSDMRFMLWRSKNRLKSNPTAMEVIKDIVSAQDIKNKFRSDRSGNEIGDGSWNINEDVFKFTGYPQVVSKVSKSETTESTYVSYTNKDNGKTIIVRFSDHENNATKFGDQLDGRFATGDEVLYKLGLKQRIFKPNKRLSIWSKMVSNKDLEKYERSDKTIQELYSLGANADISKYKGKLTKNGKSLILGDTVEEQIEKRRDALGTLVQVGKYIYVDNTIDNLLFRSSELPVESNTITLTKGQRVVEKVQDRMVSGTVLINEIKSRNGKVGAFSNFVSEETRSSSRAKAEIDDFLENYFKPVTNIIGEWHAQGISIEEAENYMKAKHAPEVNKNITSREVRQSVPLWIEASINRLNEKLGVLKTEKAKRNTQDSINTLKRQLDFINNKANASNLQQSLSNAYDVVFSGSAKSISTTGSTFDLMLAVAIHDRYIKAFMDVQSSGMSNIRSGKSDQQAMQEIAELEAKITPAQVTKFWDAVRKATRFSLDKSFKYGLISKELYDGTTGMYEYYVPLRGWDVKEEVDYSDIFGENYMGHEILNPVNKQAKGRISEAEGPLGYIGSMAETSIVAGNKNEVRRNAWRLIKNNEGMTDLFLIKDTWLVNVAELGEEAIWEQTYEVPSQEMIDMGKAKKASPNTTYEWHKTRGELEKHQVPVMIDGKRVVMEFKGKELGPRVAAAINGDNIVRWRGTEGVAKVTRIMAALKTSKNPDFMLTNFVRDFLFGGMSYYIRGGNPVAMTANLKRAWVAIHKDFTKGKENPYLKQMYEDFKMSGGETGYVHMLGQPDFMKKAERLIKDASMAGKISGASVARKTGHLINHSLDYLANMSENAMRFAAYLTEAERMMNEEGVNIPTESIKKQASLAAKELTTNFNRKGTWGSQVNGLYAFMNASIQGTANYFKLAKENPVKFVKANLALLAVRTFFNALCMLLAGDDDKDDYYSLSDYVKENNFVIPVGNRQYITIPLPHGARALTSIGLYSLEVLAGKRDAGKASVDYVKNIVSEISPVNLVGLDRSAFLLPTTISEGILTITPTILRPIAEAGANIDFMANPIERENFVITDNDYVPRFQNAYSNTNKILVGSAKFLNNEIGGGNDYRSSGIRIGSNGVPYRSKAWGIFDMSPAYTEHIIESYLGGAGRFVNDLYKTARSTVKGEVPDKRNIPVLRRFIQEPYQTKAIKGYYETRTRVSDINRAKKAALESENEFEFVQLNNAYNNELSITFDKYNKQIRKWSKIKNNIVNDDAKLEAASEHINKLMELLNKDIASIDKRYNHIRK